jgi:hypothetical protein
MEAEKSHLQAGEPGKLVVWLSPNPEASETRKVFLMVKLSVVQGHGPENWEVPGASLGQALQKMKF